MRAFALLFLAAVGCSSSESSSSAPTDAGTQAEAAADAAVTGTRCGEPPYVKWTGVATMKDGSGSKPAVGAKLTADSCPGTVLTIPADGKFELLLTKGAKGTAKLEKDGALKNMLGEWAPLTDEADIGLVLLPSLFAALIPEWDPSTGSAVVLQVEPHGTAACADLSGVSFTVKDQPAAKISYYDDGAVPTAIDGATATGKSGVVAFSKVTGSSIEIVGVKTGCKVSTVTRLQSGKVSLAPQYLTTMVAELRD